MSEPLLEDYQQEILYNCKVVVDVETTGLNVRKDKVLGVGFASQIGSFYISILEWNGYELVHTGNLPKLMEAFKILTGEEAKSFASDATYCADIICHNAAFDLRIIKHNFGVDLLPYLHCDTILLKHTLDENPPFGLKELAVKYAKELDYDRDPTEEKKELHKSIELAGGKITKTQYELFKADPKVIAKYCEQDCQLTLDLFNFLNPKLTPELSQFFYKDEVMPLYKEVSIPMMEYGIKIDVSAVSRALQEITADLNESEKEVQTQLAPYSDNFKQWFFETQYPPKTTGAFAKTMAEMFNLPLKKTKTGAVSLAKDSIAALPYSKYKVFLQTGTGLDADVIEAIQWRMHNEEGESGYFVNIRSKDHLKRIIFQYLGEKPDRFTEKGAFQLDDDYLHTLKNKYKFIPPLLVYNKLNKLKSTYMERFLEEAEDGIFYPQFNQHRTISGRFGSDIQQLPRPVEGEDTLIKRYTNMIRTFFISRDGYSFVDDDYESLEPHIFSHVSGDPGLQSIFNKGHDFYSTIAIMTEGLKGVSADKKADNYLGKVNKGARQRAKAYCLGIPYGMGDFKLSKELDIPQNEAKKLIDQYLNAFPKLNEWMNSTDEQVKTLGYVKTQLGRIRRMPEAPLIYKKYGDIIYDSLELWKEYHKDEYTYQIAKEDRRKFKNYIGNGRNFQIQGMSASVVNRATIDIARAFKTQNLKANLSLQLHDEVLVECKDEDVEVVKQVVQSCMENVVQLSVKLKAVPSVGKTYAEAK